MLQPDQWGRWLSRGRGSIDRTRGRLLIILRELVAQIGVFLQQPGQLGGYHVEEGIHFVFVIAPLASRRLTECHTAHLCRG
jgi:hypothetical protein